MEPPTVENEKDLVAVKFGWSPIDDEQPADRWADAELLSHLADTRLQRRFARFQITTGDVPRALVRRLDQEHPVLVVDEQGTAATRGRARV